jgi:hypothetical protein
VPASSKRAVLVGIKVVHAGADLGGGCSEGVVGGIAQEVLAEDLLSAICCSSSTLLHALAAVTAQMARALPWREQAQRRLSCISYRQSPAPTAAREASISCPTKHPHPPP